MMQVLKQLKHYLNDLLAGMAPSTRITLASLVALVLVCIGWLAVSEPQDRKVMILGTLTAADAAKAVDVLREANLTDFEFSQDSSIRVPETEKARYLKALSDGGALPKNWDDIINDSVKGSFLEPNSVRQQKRENGREQAFARLLEDLPQIASAAVDYDEVSHGFASESMKVCSIQLKGHDNRPIETRIRKNVVQHATTHFAGLQVTNVSVMDLGTGDIYREGLTSNVLADNPMLALQTAWEDHYTSKLQELLSHYGSIKLGVSVQLKPGHGDAPDANTDLVVTEKSTTRRTTNRSGVESDGNSGLIGRLLFNGPLTLAETEEVEEVWSERGAPASPVTQIASSVPSRVRISVGIPESYYARVLDYRRQAAVATEIAAPPARPSPQELATVREEVKLSVESAVRGLCLSNSETSDQVVQVYSFVDLIPGPAPAPTLEAMLANWFEESWLMLAVCVPLIVLLIVPICFRAGQRRARKRADLDLQAPAEQLSDELELTPAEAYQDNDSSHDSTDATQSDLSQLVRDNPEATAEVIKRWLEAA